MGMKKSLCTEHIQDCRIQLYYMSKSARPKENSDGFGAAIGQEYAN